MSTNGETDVKNVNMTVLMICVSTIIVAFVVGVVAVFLAAPSTRDPMPLITILFANLTILIPSLGAMFVARSVKSDTQALLNGTGEAKIKKAVHAVLDERQADTA